MGYAADTGYVPLSISEIIESFRVGVNGQFNTNYIQETFVGSNWYKFYYSLAQRVQKNEIKTAEIFTRMQEYFRITNERILRPNTTHPGIIDYFQSKGYLASTKAPNDTDRGKLFICVDVDETAEDYAAKKIEVCQLVKDVCVGGVVSQGDQVETIALGNGQSFDFKFGLPNRIPVALRLTITTSENNLFAIDDPLVVRDRLYANVLMNYKLGKNFEPQRYFSVANAPWASTVLLEYTDDVTGDDVDPGAVWNSTVYDSAFNDLFEFSEERIQVVEV